MPEEKLLAECDISSQDFSVSRLFSIFESIGLGLENIWSQKKVSVSKILVSKKSLGIGLDEIFWSRHSVPVVHV